MEVQLNSFDPTIYSLQETLNSYVGAQMLTDEDATKVANFLRDNRESLQFLDRKKVDELNAKLAGRVSTALAMCKNPPESSVSKEEAEALELIQQQFDSLENYPAAYRVLKIVEKYGPRITSIIVTSSHGLKDILTGCPNLEKLQVGIPESRQVALPSFMFSSLGFESSSYKDEPPYLENGIVQDLVKLTKLTHITAYSELWDDGLEVFGKMSKLELIDLELLCFSPSSFLASGSFENLTTLRLSGCEFAWTNLFKEAALTGKMKNLQKLSLETQRLLNKDDSLLEELSRFTTLRNLELNLARPSGGQAQEIYIALAKMTNLETYISLGIGNQELSSLAKLPNLKKLHIGTVDETTLKAVGLLTSLETLAISSFQFIGPKIDTVQALAALTQIQCLDLSETLPSFSHKVREGLTNLTTLKILN